MILKQVIKYSNANVLEATWVDENDNIIKCHAYADVQMNELRADLGADAVEYESMIAEVEADIIPIIPEPIVIPQVVTMRQARLALLEQGLLATVDTAIAGGTDEAMKIEWEYATEVRRDWASLITMTETLGMTSAQLDDLFLLASTK